MNKATAIYLIVAAPVALVGIGLCVIGAVAGPTPEPVEFPSRAPSTIVPDTGSRPTVNPSPRPDTIRGGVWSVGEDVKPGEYRVISELEISGFDVCYWEITDKGGSIVDNGLPTGGKPRVELKDGQGFTTQGCGEWALVR